jgi:hypothetical protein
MLGDLRFWGLVAVVVGGLLVFVRRSLAQRRLAFTDYDRKAIEPIYRSLRDQALAFKPGDLELQGADGSGAYGVVMDVGQVEAIVTVTSFTSGDASIYVSTGGGMLGGVAHETVRTAAGAFVDEAEKRRRNMSLVTEFPLPKMGWARVYVLTPQGVFGALVRTLPVEANFEALMQAGERVMKAIEDAMPKSTSLPPEIPPTSRAGA